jgi:saposin
MKYIIILALALFAAFTSAFQLNVQVPADALDCEMCQYVVSRVESYLKDNSTDQEILTYLENDCKALVKSDWVTECQQMIKSYGPTIITYIINSETPELACTEIGLCTSVTAPKVSNAVECSACELITKQAESYIQANHTEDEIIAALNKDCSLLHYSSWVSTCQGIVKEYGNEIITMLINKESPEAICTKLKLCASFKALATDPQCVLCEYLVDKVDTYLANNETDTAIIDYLTHDCTALKDSTIVTECKTIVAIYGPEIIKLLVKDMPAATVCEELKLCAQEKEQAL